MQIPLKDFYSELAGNLVRKLPVTPNKFTNNSTKQYYINVEKNYHNFELCNETLENIKKILFCMDTSKARNLDGMSSKFLKDGAEVVASPLWNLADLSINNLYFQINVRLQN